MNDCVFCKIAKKEIAADIVFENEQFVCILDMKPVRKGHVLVISKAHYEWIQDMPEELARDAFSLATSLINPMKKALGCDYGNIVVEGEQVSHAHIHVIPSTKGNLNATWHHVEYDDNVDKIYFRELIRNAL